MPAVIVGQLSRSEREDLLRMFELFDMEQKGTISLLEFKSVLEEVAKEDNDENESSKRATLERVLALPAFQTQQDRQLTQEEFVQILSESSSEEEDQVKHVFDLFDTDKKGYINVDDLRRIADELGESMNEDELQEMIQRASQDGRVTLEDFEAVLNHKLMA